MFESTGWIVDQLGTLSEGGRLLGSGLYTVVTLTVDLDPTFHFNADSDPGPSPYQSAANSRLLVYKPSTAHFGPPRLHCERLRP